VKLLLDEHLTARIAIELRRQGHDVVAVLERPDLQRAADEVLWAVARTEHRGVVTRDVGDFSRLAMADAAIEKVQPALVLIHHRRFPPGGRDMGRLVTGLRSVLVANPADDGLAGRVVWLELAAE
jgi:predicted nuclease of predicted toxin-antitoxin system